MRRGASRKRTAGPFGATGPAVGWVELADLAGRARHARAHTRQIELLHRLDRLFFCLLTFARLLTQDLLHLRVVPDVEPALFLLAVGSVERVGILHRTGRQHPLGAGWAAQGWRAGQRPSHQAPWPPQNKARHAGVPGIDIT